MTCFFPLHIAIEDGNVISNPAVHVRSELTVRNFTAGALPFGDFSLGEQGKVTRGPGRSARCLSNFLFLVFSFCIFPGTICAQPSPATEPSSWATPPIDTIRHEARSWAQPNPLKFMMLAAIYGYQDFLSSQDGPTCGFVPSCSRYGAAAIRRYGPFQGLLLTVDRLLRCNPSARGKYPLAPDRDHFRDNPSEHALW